MKRLQIHLVALIILLIPLSSASVYSQGPGLPNLEYSDSELFTHLSIIHDQNDQGQPRGQNVVAMVNGYLFYVYGTDGGAQGGGISFWDISDPRNPNRIFRKDVNALRESHGMGFHDQNGKTYVAMQGGEGVLIWDITDPRNPFEVNYVKIPGTAFSDYDHPVWWVFYQTPYIYASGGLDGLHILRAETPESARFVKTVPISQLGNFQTGPLFIMGNLLTTTAVGNGRKGISTVDISDPLNPVLLDVTLDHFTLYSAFMNGDYVYGAGEDGRLKYIDISNPQNIRQTRESNVFGGRGEYLHIQDNFAHMGVEDVYVKIDLVTMSQVGESYSFPSEGQEGFANPLGNLVMITDDHALGSSLVPHQKEKDLAPPVVNATSPKNGSVDQALTLRIGFSFTDQIDNASINANTIEIKSANGEIVEGYFSTQTNFINFGPKDDLLPGTTYNVTVKAGGIKDYAGNVFASDYTFSFTTAGQSATDYIVQASDLIANGTNVYEFTVIFTGSKAVNPQDLDGDDWSVSSTAGYQQKAKLVLVDTISGNGYVRAKYSVESPGQEWVPADNGTYVISLLPNQIRNSEEAYFQEGQAATFLVNISLSAGNGRGIEWKKFNLNGGNSVSSLTTSSNFPNNPDATGMIGPNGVFEYQSSGSFGSQIAGYFIAPETGSYTFYISSDDASELYLSTNENESSKTRIAYTNEWTNPGEWNKFPSQMSSPINLEMGKRYYIESLHVNGSGNNHVQVGVQYPSGDLDQPIPGHRLDPLGTVGLNTYRAWNNNWGASDIPALYITRDRKVQYKQELKSGFQLFNIQGAKIKDE